MKNAKRLTAFLVSLVTIFACASVAFAAVPDTSALSEYITVDECMIAGEKWIMANYPTGTKVSSIIPIKDLDNRLNGYCISFSYNDEPKGYLVLNATKYTNSYIREFAIDGMGIYDQLVLAVQTRGNVEKVIYSTNPFEYAVKCSTIDEDIYYNSNSTVLTGEEEQFVFGSADFSNNVEPISDDKEEYYAAFFDESDLTNYTAKNDKIVTGADSYTPKTMSDLLTGINTGNCSPTALTNICGYYYDQGKTKILVNNSIYDTYDALVEATGFDINKEYSVYSGVSYQKAMNTLRTYVKDRSYRITLDRYSFDWWSDFKRDLGNNKLVFMAIGGEKLNVNNDWVEVSHQLIGIGYRIMNDGKHYIRVYDGWNASSDRFLDFDSPYLDYVYGASVTIS